MGTIANEVLSTTDKKELHDKILAKAKAASSLFYEYGIDNEQFGNDYDYLAVLLDETISCEIAHGFSVLTKHCDLGLSSLYRISSGKDIDPNNDYPSPDPGILSAYTAFYDSTQYFMPNSEDYNEPGRLQVITLIMDRLNMNALATETGSPRQMTYLLLHELGHRWAAFWEYHPVNGQDYLDLFESRGGHWDYPAMPSSDESQEEDNVSPMPNFWAPGPFWASYLTSMNDATDSAKESNVCGLMSQASYMQGLLSAPVAPIMRYAPVELYLMGLLPYQDVISTTLQFKNYLYSIGLVSFKEALNTNFVFNPENLSITFEQFTSKDQNGTRWPSYPKTQKSFKMATVVISRQKLPQWRANEYIDFIKSFETNFHIATNYCGTMDARIASVASTTVNHPPRITSVTTNIGEIKTLLPDKPKDYIEKWHYKMLDSVPTQPVTITVTAEDIDDDTITFAMPPADAGYTTMDGATLTNNGNNSATLTWPGATAMKPGQSYKVAFLAQDRQNGQSSSNDIQNDMVVVELSLQPTIGTINTDTKSPDSGKTITVNTRVAYISGYSYSVNLTADNGISIPMICSECIAGGRGGIYSAQIGPLTSGDHTLTATATNNASNTTISTTKEITVTQETSPPTIGAIQTTPASPDNDDRITVTVQVTDISKVGLVILRVNNSTPITMTCPPGCPATGGAYSATIGPLAAGNHNLTVTATDSVKNTSTSPAKQINIIRATFANTNPLFGGTLGWSTGEFYPLTQPFWSPLPIQQPIFSQPAYTQSVPFVLPNLNSTFNNTFNFSPLNQTPATGYQWQTPALNNSAFSNNFNSQFNISTLLNQTPATGYQWQTPAALDTSFLNKANALSNLFTANQTQPVTPWAGTTISYPQIYQNLILNRQKK
ncbi:MAG: hypothetical protein V1753_03440 [Pseudomonadota bacterium]